MSSFDHTPAHRLAAQAAAELATFTGVDSYHAAITLGSGWAGATEQLGLVVASVPAHEIVGFRASAVQGHTGMLNSVQRADGTRVLVIAGRTHLYEGHGVDAVAHSVRVAAAAGAKAIVLTNGAGGLRENQSPGEAMLISDHINLTAVSPLQGANFVDLTDVYSADVRARVLARLRGVHEGVSEGVYAQVLGPNYETPAEIRYLQTIGADAVGMSTAIEAITARSLGLRVVGVSLITNLAAGLAGPLNHEEVLAAGNAAVEQGALGSVLDVVLEELLVELPA